MCSENLLHCLLHDIRRHRGISNLKQFLACDIAFLFSNQASLEHSHLLRGILWMGKNIKVQPLFKSKLDLLPLFLRVEHLRNASGFKLILDFSDILCTDGILGQIHRLAVYPKGFQVIPHLRDFDHVGNLFRRKVRIAVNLIVDVRNGGLKTGKLLHIGCAQAILGQQLVAGFLDGQASTFSETTAIHFLKCGIVKGVIPLAGIRQVDLKIALILRHKGSFLGFFLLWIRTFLLLLLLQFTHMAFNLRDHLRSSLPDRLKGGLQFRGILTMRPSGDICEAIVRAVDSKMLTDGIGYRLRFDFFAVSALLRHLRSFLIRSNRMELLMCHLMNGRFDRLQLARAFL